RSWVGAGARRPRDPLEAAELHGARRAAVQQPHELLVDLVDASPPRLDLGGVGRRPLRRVRRRGLRHIPLLSHRTCSATSPFGLSSRKRTRALPTTTPSARAAAGAPGSAVERPKPRATGSLVRAPSRSTSGPASFDSESRSPVMPVRL